MLLGAHHTTSQRDRIMGHLSIAGKATQRVDALARQIVISGGIVLDRFAVLDEVALATLVDLTDLGVAMVAFLPSSCH